MLQTHQKTSSEVGIHATGKPILAGASKGVLYVRITPQSLHNLINPVGKHNDYLFLQLVTIYPPSILIKRQATVKPTRPRFTQLNRPTSVHSSKHPPTARMAVHTALLRLRRFYDGDSVSLPWRKTVRDQLKATPIVDAKPKCPKMLGHPSLWILRHFLNHQCSLEEATSQGHQLPSWDIPTTLQPSSLDQKGAAEQSQFLCWFFQVRT